MPVKSMLEGGEGVETGGFTELAIIQPSGIVYSSFSKNLNLKNQDGELAQHSRMLALSGGSEFSSQH